MTMARARIRGWRRLAAGAAALAIADFLLGLTPWLLLAGACACVSWHVYNVHRLARWLAGDDRELDPATRGIWGQVFESLSRIRRQNRKRKKRLRKVVARFQQAAEALPDGAIVLDADGIILWMNKASSGLLGLESPRDVGQPMADFVRNPEFAEVLNAEAFDEPLHLTSPLRRELQLLIRIVPYGGSRRLMVVRNVTRLHNLEQMRKDFVANVSHELRSPLTVVVGYLESLEDDGSLPAEFRRPVAQMSQQAARMSLIVEDLLQLSRLEATPGAASVEPVAVPEMLESIARDARALREGVHRIFLHVDPELSLRGDWNELYSAFSNIAFNAVQHTRAGGTVRLRWAPDGEGGARLDVTDTGEGIEEIHIPRLTERFYRVDKGRSHEMGGTGLGLAIVKHVLVRHDARLEVESRLGEGSRFSCRFPAHRAVSSETPHDQERQAVA